MANNAEHLEAIFLKENLAKTDVVNLLAGHRVRLAKNYGGNSTVYNLVTGEAVVGSKAKDIIERWRSLKEIWESSTHGGSNIDLTSDPTADDMMISRDYVLRWAWDKHKPNSNIWEGFSACLKHGLEQEWITPHDYVPQEETQKEPEPGKEKPESPKELKNRMRLIGVLADMLKDETIAHEDKKNAVKIATYIENTYALGVGNKGIGKDTVEKILGKAKALLEDEEIIEKPKK